MTITEAHERAFHAGDDARTAYLRDVDGNNQIDALGMAIDAYLAEMEAEGFVMMPTRITEDQYDATEGDFHESVRQKLYSKFVAARPRLTP